MLIIHHLQLQEVQIQVELQYLLTIHRLLQQELRILQQLQILLFLQVITLLK